MRKWSDLVPLIKTCQAKNIKFPLVTAQKILARNVTLVMNGMADSQPSATAAEHLAQITPLLPWQDEQDGFEAAIGWEKAVSLRMEKLEFQPLAPKFCELDMGIKEKLDLCLSLLVRDVFNQLIKAEEQSAGLEGSVEQVGAIFRDTSRKLETKISQSPCLTS